MEFQTDDALSRKTEKLPTASSQEHQTPAFPRLAEGPTLGRGWGGGFPWGQARRAPSPELHRAGPQAGWLCPASFPVLELWRRRPGGSEC